MKVALRASVLVGLLAPVKAMVSGLELVVWRVDAMELL